MVATPFRFRARATVPLLALFAVLACARMPDVLRSGRFWAEEGRFFFEDAWVLPFGSALFHGIGGYLNLLANAATLGARWLLPLGWAPYGTIAVALGVQLAPPFLLLSARDPWLRPLPVRALAVATLLFAPSSDEIWLQTLHCQFELTLCAAIVLALDTAAGPGLAAVRLLLLALAPLCGPGVAALLPLFALRVALDRCRDRRRLWQLVVLGAATAVQLLGFYQPAGTRSFSLTPGVFATILYLRHLVLPFEGVNRADAVAAVLRARLAAGHPSHLAILAPVAAAALAFAAAVSRAGSRPAAWLLAAGLIVAALSYLGAIGLASQLVDPRFGERYAFVPSALFALALLVLAATARPAVRLCCSALLGWQLLVCGTGFFHPWALIAHGPAWRPQVSAWRADPSRRLAIWPDGWTMTLDPAHRAQDR